MLKDKKSEIELAMDNLKEAMINEMTLSLKEDALKLEKTKAHNEVVLAKEVVANLQIR